MNRPRTQAVHENAHCAETVFQKKRRTQNDYYEYYVRRFIFRGDASRVAPLTTCDYTEERAVLQRAR